MPSTAWPNIVSDICGTFGAPTDEGFSALGCGIAPVPTCHLSRGVKVSPSCAAALRPFSHQVDNRDNGCLSGWGVTVLDGTANGSWEPEAGSNLHKPLGTLGSVLCTKALSDRGAALLS